MRTSISNEPALKQFASANGDVLLSIIRAGDHFRFVEESRIYQPSSNGLDGYHYWAGTHRSGLYVGVGAAEAAAMQEVNWIGRAADPD